MLECVRAQSFSYVRLLASPWSVACQNFNSVNGIFQARIPEWVAISYSLGPSWSKNWTHISCISCIGRETLHHCTTWEARIISYCFYIQMLSHLNFNRKNIILINICYFSKSYLLPFWYFKLMRKSFINSIPFENKKKVESNFMLSWQETT